MRAVQAESAAPLTAPGGDGRQLRPLRIREDGVDRRHGRGAGAGGGRLRGGESLLAPVDGIEER